MPRLAAGLPSTCHPTTTLALATGETIRGRRLGGGRGILLAKRELAFEIGNPFRLLGELLAKPFVLLFQALNLVRLAITARARLLLTRRSLLALRLHRPERTKSLQQQVQVQN
jgi:hypothetical protein